MPGVLSFTSLELQWRCAWPWKHGTAPADSPPLPKKSRRADAEVRKLLAVGAEQRELALHHVPRLSALEKPRSTHNAASLAYIGDAVYELYVRRHFLTPPQSMDKYNASVMALVCCEAQDSLLRQLLREKYLSDEERDVVRWGKNVVSSHRRATRRAGTAVYSSATALEALIGYLYLTDLHRLEELMEKLGFTGSRP